VSELALEPQPEAAHLDDTLFLACGLAWCAGAIDVAAAVSHFSGSALYAVTFMGLAAAQFLLGVAIYRQAGRRLLIFGACLSLAVALIWIASCTTGLPVGSSPWTAQPVGTGGFIAGADEFALALIVACQLGAGRAGALTRGVKRVVSVAGIFLILLSSLILTLGSSHVSLAGPIRMLCHLG
jgi:hypothetical protein